MDTSLTLLRMPTDLSPQAARAHAIKNCLAVVCAVQKLLEHHLTGEARSRLARAQDAVLRMRALLDEEIAAPSHVPEKAFCPAEDIVRAVVVRAEDRAEAGEVRLVIHSGTGGVHGVHDELVEALFNVVLNAIEVTPAGGIVSISTCRAPDGAQFWTVQDAGPGIAVHVVPRLGRPFVSGKEGGTGLGLAVAQSIVERHEGLIRFESSARSGTLVALWFPPPLDR
jgi:signal transduction histidine kinase